MPKINSAGVPSYAGHEGVVTNAVGEQFEVNPSRDLEGNRPENYVDEPVGDAPEETEPVSGDIRPETERDDEDTETTRRDDADALDVRDKAQDESDGKATSKRVPATQDSPAAAAKKK
jgi:hypothetical protein